MKLQMAQQEIEIDFETESKITKKRNQHLKEDSHN